MIEVKKLTKAYSNGKGVFDLEFTVGEGEVFGYLGPNGAGKTTTIRNLLGFINPTGGSCSIDGLDCRFQAPRIQEQLGYLPGEINFFEEMTGNDFLDFMGAMRGNPSMKRRSELVTRFELEGERRIRKMSKGMKQKVGLVNAFMHDPKVLILDEPTSGLDPLMQSRFVELILQEKKRGKTIMMSSHSFEEIEKTCDRAGIIKEGRLVANESISALKAGQRKEYVVTLKDPKDGAQLLLGSYEVSPVSDRMFRVKVQDNLNELLLVLARCDVEKLDSSTQSLEDAFMQYYGKEAH